MDARDVVLGFRPHTYWTAVVAVTGEPASPQVVRRARFEFAEGETRLVYHRASEMTVEAAAAWIERVRLLVEESATAAVAPLLASLREEGWTIRQAVVPRGGAKPARSLSDIMRSHSAQHGAEGEFYRDVVAKACRAHGLEVTRVIERELPALVADELGRSSAALAARLQEIGRELGPPWSEDQRLAMMAAWWGLASARAPS